MPGADAPTTARMRALGAAGSIAYWRSERERAIERYREQLALAQRLERHGGHGRCLVQPGVGDLRGR